MSLLPCHLIAPTSVRKLRHDHSYGHECERCKADRLAKEALKDQPKPQKYPGKWYPPDHGHLFIRKHIDYYDKYCDMCHDHFITHEQDQKVCDKCRGEFFESIGGVLPRVRRYQRGIL